MYQIGMIQTIKYLLKRDWTALDHKATNIFVKNAFETALHTCFK